MGGRLVALALLMVATAPAWGQSDEDFAKYARPKIDEFTACAYPKVQEMAKEGSKTPAEIVDLATAECQEHLDDLKAVVMKPPFGWSSEQSDQEIKSMLEQMRPGMLKTAQGV